MYVFIQEMLAHMLSQANLHRTNMVLAESVFGHKPVISI